MSDSIGYYPEMGEKPDLTKLFQSNYVWKCYGIEWREEQHAQALEVLKTLRIRAKKPNGIELVECRDGSKKYRALVTYAAHDKLISGGYVCIEFLLD